MKNVLLRTMCTFALLIATAHDAQAMLRYAGRRLLGATGTHFMLRSEACTGGRSTASLLYCGLTTQAQYSQNSYKYDPRGFRSIVCPTKYTPITLDVLNESAQGFVDYRCGDKLDTEEKQERASMMLNACHGFFYGGKEEARRNAVLFLSTGLIGEKPNEFSLGLARFINHLLCSSWGVTSDFELGKLPLSAQFAAITQHLLDQGFEEWRAIAIICAEAGGFVNACLPLIADDEDDEEEYLLNFKRLNIG